MEDLHKNFSYVDIKVILSINGVPVELILIDPTLIQFKKWEHLFYDAERKMEA